MATKTTNFKVGDIVRLTNPIKESKADLGKIGRVILIYTGSMFPIKLEFPEGQTYQATIFEYDELELVPKEELPLWQLKLPRFVRASF